MPKTPLSHAHLRLYLDFEKFEEKYEKKKIKIKILKLINYFYIFIQIHFIYFFPSYKN